ncbi:hypothetical protein [Trichocoleus sp. ST-U1]|uniref:hypothetical protein n=1 Tax=Trichocoleus sp. ST-U1 TaxID=2933928 RepID=UPI00329A4E25
MNQGEQGLLKLLDKAIVKESTHKYMRFPGNYCHHLNSDEILRQMIRCVAIGRNDREIAPSTFLVNLLLNLLPPLANPPRYGEGEE